MVIITPSTAANIGLGLLRLSPAVLTTTLFVNRAAQYVGFTSFLSPHIPAEKHDSAPTFQLWFRQVVDRIFSPVVTLTQVQRILCIANLIVGRHTIVPAAWWLYILTVVFGNAHLPFVPRLLRCERAMLDAKNTPQQSLAVLRDWMALNNVRVLVVDVPLFVVSIAAALASAQWT